MTLISALLLDVSAQDRATTSRVGGTAPAVYYATTPLFSKSTIRTIIERLGSKGMSSNPHRR